MAIIKSLKLSLCLGLLVAISPASAYAAPWQIMPASQLPDADRTTHKVELVDINGDGAVDIVFANSKGDGVSGGLANAELNQLLINSNGTFAALPTAFDEPDNAWVIKAGDLDNDGDPDLVVGDNFSGSHSYALLNEGNFTFTREDIVGSADANIGDLELGDLDGDGFLDILASDWGPLPHGDLSDPGGPLRLWLGNGDGTFSDGDANLMMGLELLAAWSFDLELVDINNDFALDVMVSTRGAVDPALVLLNDGAGHFFEHVVPPLQPMDTKNINVAFTPMDFDGDDFFDVISLQDGGPGGCNGDPPVCTRRDSLLLGDQNSGFTLPANYWPGPHNPGMLDFDAATLDFNNDGKPDFVVTGVRAAPGDNNSRLLLNDGATFSYPSQPDEVAFPLVDALGHVAGLMFADLNGDRRVDVAVAQPDPALPNFALFGSDDPVSGVPTDTTPPRIYELASFGEKLPSLLYFDEHVTLEARVNDYKTPTHWHDYLHDPALNAYNLVGDGAALTAHNRRLPYLEFALSLADPSDLLAMADSDPNKYIAPSIWFGEALWRVRFTVPYGGKAEDTLTWQFCAIDAAENKTCVGPFSVKLEIHPPDCGDGIVEEWEQCDDDSPTCINCQLTCGDGVCDAVEDGNSCPQDCGPCNHDGACQPPEDPGNCLGDCDYDGVCGDDICQNPPEHVQNCPEDCDPCDHDGACQPPENPANCPDDCDHDGFCGDGIRQPPETPENCPQDGGSCNQDDACQPPEHPGSCPDDCDYDGFCGDSICQDPPEIEANCPVDCGGITDDAGHGVCGDCICEAHELYACPEDCGGSPTCCLDDCDDDGFTPDTGADMGSTDDGCGCHSRAGERGFGLALLLLLRRRRRPLLAARARLS